MEDEVRNAPPTVRTNMNSRVTGYKSELLNLKRSVVSNDTHLSSLNSHATPAPH
jgi:hypothetical protein